VLVEAFEFSSQAFASFKPYQYDFSEAFFEDLRGHFAHLYALTFIIGMGFFY
jgi:hypothetical protein